MVISWLGRPALDEFAYIFISIAKGIGLTLLLIGIPWLLNQIREAFRNIRPPEGDSAMKLTPLLQNHFTDKKAFYVILALLLIPLIFIIWVIISTEIRDFSYWYSFKFSMTYLWVTFEEISQFNWALLYWIFAQIFLNILFFYFLGIILWMLLEVVLTLKDAKGDSKRDQVPVDILAADGIGGLGPVQSVMRSLITYYSIIVTLVLIIPRYHHHTSDSFLEGFFGFPALVMIVILIVGILFFYFGFGLIQDLVRSQVNEEIEDLNKQIRSRSKHIKERISCNEKIEIEELKEDDLILDICNKEKDRLVEIYNRNAAYDTRTIAQSIVSFLIPIINLFSRRKE